MTYDRTILPFKLVQGAQKELKRRGLNVSLFSTNSILNDKVEQVSVLSDGRVTVAVAEDAPGSFMCAGVSFRCPRDKDNFEVGAAIALSRLGRLLVSK